MIHKVYLLSLIISASTVCARATDFNILDYGAKSDTTVVSTQAFNKAINACFESGGGKVIVPPGMYLSGTILLKNNVELYLSIGSTIYGSTNSKDFPAQKQKTYLSDKEENGWYALIYGEALSNIAVTGGGTIDGNGLRQRGKTEKRPRNILFISCSKVRIQNITLKHSVNWNQHYLNCEDVVVDGITVYNHSNKNNDGIDIDGCRRFILSNSIIDSDDDAVVLKSTGVAPCENITMTNCILSSHTNAIKCGTESIGGFKNIVISNCIVKPSESKEEPIFKTPHHGFTGISLEIVDGGIMDGVSIDNITIEGTECPLFVRLANRGRKTHESAPEPPLGQMRNIQISNIIAYNTGNFSSSITGIPQKKIENIYLSNIRFFSKGGLKKGQYIESIDKVPEKEKSYPQPNIWGCLPSYGLFIRHVDNITVSNSTFKSNDDPRKAIIAADIGNLKIIDIEWNDDIKENLLLMQDVNKHKMNP